MFGFGKNKKGNFGKKALGMAAMMSMFGGRGLFGGHGSHSGDKACNNPECKKKTISASYCSLKCAVLHKRACGGVEMV